MFLFAFSLFKNFFFSPSVSPFPPRQHTLYFSFTSQAARTLPFEVTRTHSLSPSSSLSFFSFAWPSSWPNFILSLWPNLAAPHSFPSAWPNPWPSTPQQPSRLPVLSLTPIAKVIPYLRVALPPVAHLPSTLCAPPALPLRAALLPYSSSMLNRALAPPPHLLFSHRKWTPPSFWPSWPAMIGLRHYPSSASFSSTFLVL